MPRSLRIDFPGAFYHMMARGNRRKWGQVIILAMIAAFNRPILRSPFAIRYPRFREVQKRGSDKWDVCCSGQSTSIRDQSMARRPIVHGSGSLFAESFEQFDFTYQLNGKAMSNKIYIPTYDGYSQPPVRGVMQNVGGPLKTFAHDNQVAMIAGLDEGRGFSKALLAAAAEAAKRPEIEFAGAIAQGISRGGREAADWASANQQKAIAVILDHSAIWSMDFPKRVSEVPMFFNATRHHCSHIFRVVFLCLKYRTGPSS